MKKLLIAFATFLLLVGCTSSIERVGETNLLETRQVPDGNIKDYLEDHIISGNIYYLYEPIISMDILFMTAEYWEYYADEMQKVYHWTEKERLEFLSEQKFRETSSIRLLMLINNMEYDSVEINRPQSEWELFLKSNSSGRIYPSEMKKMAEGDRHVVYLQNILDRVDRWSNIYMVSFPRFYPEEDTTSEVVFTGLKGFLSFPAYSGNIEEDSDGS